MEKLFESRNRHPYEIPDLQVQVPAVYLATSSLRPNAKDKSTMNHAWSWATGQHPTKNFSSFPVDSFYFPSFSHVSGWFHLSFARSKSLLLCQHLKGGRCCRDRWTPGTPAGSQHFGVDGAWVHRVEAKPDRAKSKGFGALGTSNIFKFWKGLGFDHCILQMALEWLRVSSAWIMSFHFRLLGLGGSP